MWKKTDILEKLLETALSNSDDEQIPLINASLNHSNISDESVILPIKRTQTKKLSANSETVSKPRTSQSVLSRTSSPSLSPKPFKSI
jgi:hypothetical protein